MSTAQSNQQIFKRKPRYEDAMNNPEKFFSHPNDIVASDDFSHEQKIELLKQWKNDLSSRHEAETEGMDRPNDARKQLLPSVTDALIKLGVQSTPADDKRN